MVDLSKVSILIKTFLRPWHLLATVEAIAGNLPQCRMIIVDDSDIPLANRVICRLGELDQYIRLPFDSGFGMKSNVGAAACQTEYLLIASDDFDFRPVTVKAGIEKLVNVLDDPEMKIDVASGRVNGNRYEGWLTDEGSENSERYITWDRPRVALAGTQRATLYYDCNLTVNYSLIRRSILGPDKIRWDDDVKIGGGEHGAFFVDVMRAGHKVAFVPGVEIKELTGLPTDPRYPSFRGRARRPERECFKRRGIREYVCFGGSVEVVP